ncbi:MAG: PAS domain S-box-containing protein [Halobacteriales archaeon]|jgi:PAS domain S-box-containing protein
MADRSLSAAITVLYVTTDGEHSSATRRALGSREGFEVVERSRVEDGLELLRGGDVDCVISDHDLPDTDGIAFLEAVRSEHPDLPFLLFTAEGSEAVASRAISANVTEYLIKESYRDQWDRLADLVRESVRYHRSRSPLVDMRRKAETVLRASPDTIAVVEDGRFVYVNDAGLELFAVDDQAALQGTPLADRLREDAATEASRRIDDVRQGERGLDRFETAVVTAEGNERVVEVTVTRIAWRGQPAVLLICRDVTERRKSEHDRALLRRLIDRADAAAFVIDDETAAIVDANDAACESLGYDREELHSLTVPDISARFEDVPDYLSFIETTDGNRESPIEDEHVRSDGTRFPVEVSAASVTIDGADYRLAMARDVTERREMERTLRESEERYRTLFESIRDAILVVDTDERIVDCNPAFEDLFGYDLDEIEGKHTSYVYENEAEYERLGEALDGRMADPNHYVTVNYETESGAVFPGETNVFYLRDDDGEVRGFIGLIRDVSDRLERERQLRRYEQAVEQSIDLLVAIDEENTVIFANRRYREFYGLSRDDVGAVSIEECLGEETFSRIEPYIERAKEGEPVEFEMERRGPDGEPRTMDVRYYPIANEQGDFAWGVGTLRDVTERVEMESELRTYRGIVERVDDPILLQGLDGNYRVVNDAVTEYAGLTEEELLGTDEFAFMDADAAERIAEMKRRVVETASPVDYEVSAELPTKGSRTFATTRYPHYDEDGEVDGTVAICRDVTEQRDREQQLTVLDRILRHNLHNEMNVVMGHAEEILDDPDGDHAASARQILASGRDLVELADKERRIVRLLSDDPRIETVELRPLLSTVVSELRESYPESRLSVECGESLRVTAERNLRVAVRELAENGIVHNDRERPAVEIAAVRAGDDVRITVADDGPGIPAAEQQVLTGGQEVQPLIHGSGLGLWLVNHVVRRSSGSLRFREHDPRGSAVEIRLPAP